MSSWMESDEDNSSSPTEAIVGTRAEAAQQIDTLSPSILRAKRVLLQGGKIETVERLLNAGFSQVMTAEQFEARKNAIVESMPQDPAFGKNLADKRFWSLAAPLIFCVLGMTIVAISAFLIHPTLMFFMLLIAPVTFLIRELANLDGIPLKEWSWQSDDFEDHVESGLIPDKVVEFACDIQEEIPYSSEIGIKYLYLKRYDSSLDLDSYTAHHASGGFMVVEDDSENATSQAVFADWFGTARQQQSLFA